MLLIHALLLAPLSLSQNACPFQIGDLVELKTEMELDFLNAYYDEYDEDIEAILDAGSTIECLEIKAVDPNTCTIYLIDRLGDVLSNPNSDGVLWPGNYFVTCDASPPAEDDALGSTVRAPYLSPIGGATAQEQHAAQQMPQNKAPGELSFQRVESEAAGIQQ